MYSELPVFFLCPQKKQLKNRLASPPSTLVQTLTDSVHFFLSNVYCQWWMYLFVWSCFQFLSVHFGWDDVFRVWVYSVVVNKKKCQDMDHFQTCEDVDMRNVFLHEVSIIKDVFHIVFVILSHSKHACALDHVFPVTDTWRLFVDFKCSLSVRLCPSIQEGTY